MTLTTIQHDHDPEHGPQPGDVIKNRFVLEERLGEGGFGAVFRAFDKTAESASAANPYVAIKILHPKWCADSQALIALRREFDKAKALSHPNIVNLHDFDRDGSLAFITMEYLRGDTLRAFINRTGGAGIPIPQAWPIIKAMAEGLGLAHAEGIVHRDFKPANVIVTDEGRVKLLDFGIARRISGDQEKSLTFIRDSLTESYASLEMLLGQPAEIRDDLYALGCVVYELIVGTHPFKGIRADLARNAQIKPKRPRGLSDRQWNVLRSYLALERKNRPVDVNPLLQAFGRASGLAPKWLAAAGIGALGLGLAAAVWTIRNDSMGFTPLTPALLTEAAELQDWDHIKESQDATDFEGYLQRHPHGEFVDLAVERLQKLRMTSGAPLEPDVIALPGRAIALGKYEVTFEEYDRFAHATQRALPPDNGWGRGPRPAVNVSWEDAEDYAVWLSEKTGRRYRLPSETEWLQACEAGRTTAYCGSDDANAVAWHVRNSGSMTQPVGSKQANALGFFDMSGNVWEWTNTCSGSECMSRIVRGGSWSNLPEASKVSSRLDVRSDQAGSLHGFRLAVELSQQDKLNSASSAATP